MKRTLIIISAIVLVLLFCYFHVQGGEIKGINTISEDYTATIVKEHASATGETSQYTLNSKQITSLKNLILGTTFTRRLSNGFSYTGLKDQYHITLELTGADGTQLDFISMYCVSDLYCQVSAPYHNLNLNLNIHNSHWQDALEQILADNT